MKKESMFPNWFKNTLFGIGVFSLFVEFSHIVYAKQIAVVILLYPFMLLFVLSSAKYPDYEESAKHPDYKEMDQLEEISQVRNGKYYFNISLSLIGFFTLILLVDFKTYVKQLSTIWGNVLTSNPLIRIVIYILVLLYFVFVGGYLSYRIKYWYEYYEGKSAFEAGSKLLNKEWRHYIITSTMSIDKTVTKKALKYFDIAIRKKYCKAKVFENRGYCLLLLGFDFDALEDYNKALENNPIFNEANIYCMRALSKKGIFDYEGSLADIEKAIELSKLDNEDNEYINSIARKVLLFSSATAYYEDERDLIKHDLNSEKKHPTDRTDELKKIKRRTKFVR